MKNILKKIVIKNLGRKNFETKFFRLTSIRHYNFCKIFNKQYAFTLAEVLITIAIVGVVAAMTIPNLMVKNQKQQTIVKLKRVISELNQAYKISVNENGALSAQDMLNYTPTYLFETYWKPYLKVSKVCDVPKDCGYTSSLPYKDRKGTKASTAFTKNANIEF